MSSPVLTQMEEHGHELVLHARDPESGLKAIIAIHSTALGRALGGTRFFPYDHEADALRDVLRLSEGMSLKASVAGLPLGGGKAVIIGDPTNDKSPDLLSAYGRVVDSLSGRYVTAEDVGTTVEDMVTVRSTTRWVTGLPGAIGGSGDPSPMTARGVVAAMRAVAARLWGGSLAGRRVVVQGAGKVGGELVRRLRIADADVTVSDIVEDAAADLAAELGIATVAPEAALSAPCDILAPCALGAVLSPDTIPSLSCAAVVGSANNQLLASDDADRLDQRGIVYVPDFVANAGGIINIAHELDDEGYDAEAAGLAVDAIFDTTTRILEDAARGAITPYASAIRLARERIADAGRCHQHARSKTL